MIERIVISIITKLVSWLYARALKEVNAHVDAQAEKEAAEQSARAEVARVEAAYKEAFNGEPVTKEQRAKLNQSIADFLRGVKHDGVPNGPPPD